MKELPFLKTRRKGKEGTQQMLIPSAAMVADELNAVPPGQRSDMVLFRRSLAAKFGADACCPVTVQQHLVILSQNEGAPVWRVVDPEKPFARRLAGGPERLRSKLAEES